MRKTIFAFAAVITVVMAMLVSVSCNPLRHEQEEERNIPPTEAEAPAKYIPFETMHVTVPQGQYAVVSLGATKVATVYKTSDIIVPKTSPKTKADGPYRITYLFTDGELETASENGVEMVVAFEDTKDGDHDYNDLVFQAMVNIVNKTDGTSTTTIDLTPVAHGATKVIGLGVILYDSEKQPIVDHVITTNVRQTLFKGDEGFINTQSTRKHYDRLNIGPLNGHGEVAGIAWYIIVENHNKLFAACDYQPCLDTDRMPQGMVMMHMRDSIYYFTKGGTTYNCGNDFWNYPQEWVHIRTVYPGFDESFIGYGQFEVLATPEEGSRYYDAIKDNALEVNDDDCLYTLYGTGTDVPAEAVELWPGGLKWASCNLGATKPEEFGNFYQWANLDGYPCEGPTCAHYFPYRGSDHPSYGESDGGKLSDSYTSGDAQYDAARFNWGGKWRVPTADEISDLLNNTVQDFATIGGVFGEKFFRVVSKNGKPKDPTQWTIDYDTWIFFPYGGTVQGSTHQNYGSEGVGHYWSSSIGAGTGGSTQGRFLRCNKPSDSTPAQLRDYTRSEALNIRPVCD